MEGYGNHVVQYSGEYSLCAGCEACSMICSLRRSGFTSPNNAAIKLEVGTRSLMHKVLTCQMCEDHPCYDACPKKDEAMCIDENGIVYINEESCIGCAKCQKACKFTPSRIQIRRNKKRKLWRAVKCDLCRNNPEGPQCIKQCQVRCLGLSDGAVEGLDGLWPAEAWEEFQKGAEA